MTTPVYLTPFATDEDMATRFRSDFLGLCDREYMAGGSDGVFGAGLPWTLTSASNAFDSQGVGQGSVIYLSKPQGSFGASGILLAVDTAQGSTLTLRRLNMAAGLGQAPGPPSGLTGVTFTVPTLVAQLELASYDIERRFGISAFLTGRRPADLFDPREVRDVTILTVASKRFLDMARQAEGQQDLYFGKHKKALQELSDLLSRVTLHWIGVPEPMRESDARQRRLTR